ncbi:thioredoxin domain-containing protein 6 [Engraulis encrasicolus]|uniref:thioredoxin domain-containing protein 6 n=1 Tax=Engraulis encrasicolus TaxID=184585 RepID=UPI002FD510C0
MAGKKKEVSLQVSITNEEQWGEMTGTKGLTVVDVYQQWCGPCRAVVSLFRKIKNELGDDLLHFATAEADSIDALERYRGKCEPTFLFYGGGELVGVLRGANAPLLQRLVVEELAKEKKVLDEGAERRVVKDEGLVDEEEEEVGDNDQGDEDVLVPAHKSYTVAIIKPDVVAHGKASEIIMKIQDAGFEILAHEERTLTEDEARVFYQHKEDQPYFQELVEFMSSGPSHVLIVSQTDASADVIPTWREFIGPTDVQEAKRDKPSSLRAQYGTDSLFNGLHGSDDAERASRELAFFFPTFRLASGTDDDDDDGPAERTLALIRPQLDREHRDELLSLIRDVGFTVAMEKEVMLNEEQVRQFYSQHQDQDYFPALLHTMTSGPVLALALARRDAVRYWRSLLGPADVNQARQEQPDCLRARFTAEGGGNGGEGGEERGGGGGEEKEEEEGAGGAGEGGGGGLNQLHGSASSQEAERELEFFFPELQDTLALIKPDAMEQHREVILEEIRAAGFSIVEQREEALTREVAEEFYREHQDKPFFPQLIDTMCRGPCLMLVLTKDNAVEDWRAMMGPTDPDEARQSAPDSLRARFARDVLENTVHGSSNREHAQKKIHFLFGEIATAAENGEEEDGELALLRNIEGLESSGDFRQLEESISPSTDANEQLLALMSPEEDDSPTLMTREISDLAPQSPPAVIIPTSEVMAETQPPSAASDNPQSTDDLTTSEEPRRSGDSGQQH